MKVCGICKNQYNGNGIKYCSYVCAYKAIDLKTKQRKMTTQQMATGTTSEYPKFPTKKNKNYKIIFGFDKFIKYYYETPHGRCKADKVFLLPIYIIRFY